MVVVGTVRLNSSRLENKMARPFASTTLLDLHLNLLEKVCPYKTYIAINEDEKPLIDIAKKHSVDIIYRDSNSVKKGISKRSEELSFLKDIDDDWVLWVNGCFPLLNVDTVLDIAQQHYYIQKPIHCVEFRQNWFWKRDCGKFSSINNKDYTNVSTQGCDPVYESVHCCHVFNRKHLLANNSYWKDTPHMYLIKNKEDTIDIDTLEEFVYAEELYKNISLLS